MKSLGTDIVTFRIGSSSTGSHLRQRLAASPMRAAILNAISELSTVWNWPSNSVTSMSTTGKPSGPLLQVLPHAFLDRRDEIARHGAADDACR